MEFMDEIKVDPVDQLNQIQKLVDAVNSDKNIFILVFMSRCGHCISMHPTWKSIEDEYNESSDSNNSNIIVSDIEASNFDEKVQNKLITSKIQGYPTILYVKGKSKNVEEYDGANRDKESLKNWISSKIASFEKQETKPTRSRIHLRHKRYLTKRGGFKMKLRMKTRMKTRKGKRVLSKKR